MILNDGCAQPAISVFGRNGNVAERLLTKVSRAEAPGLDRAKASRAPDRARKFGIVRRIRGNSRPRRRTSWLFGLLWNAGIATSG
jgi:hypothetical protein